MLLIYTLQFIHTFVKNGSLCKNEVSYSKYEHTDAARGAAELGRLRSPLRSHKLLLSGSDIVSGYIGFVI